MLDFKHSQHGLDACYAFPGPGCATLAILTLQSKPSLLQSRTSGVKKDVSSSLGFKKSFLVILAGLRWSPTHLVMRPTLNTASQMQDLPVLFHIDGTVVVVVVLRIVVRLVTAVVECRSGHVCVNTTGSGLLPCRRSPLWRLLRYGALYFGRYFRFGLGRCCCRCRLRCGLIVVAVSVLATGRARCWQRRESRAV